MKTAALNNLLLLYCQDVRPCALVHVHLSLADEEIKKRS
jgi:hypothetical protein